MNKRNRPILHLLVGVNVTLPKRLLVQIDAVSRNHSGFLAQAAAEALRQRSS